MPLQGVPFEIVQVDLSNKPGWYRSIHPQTLVPSLVAGGQTVVESVDICRQDTCRQHKGPDLSVPLASRVAPGLLINALSR